MVTAPVVTEENIKEKQPENETKDTTRFAFASTDETLKNLQKELYYRCTATCLICK